MNQCDGRQKRPYNTQTKRRTYTVTDEVHAELQMLGKGNASRGIREAVKAAQVRTPTSCRNPPSVE